MKPKVLVAEDNIDHLELLSDALSTDNIVVGTDSLEGCMENLTREKFDLVVLDYNLKKNFSGFDILKEINIKYPYLPVIMVTAYGNEELAVKVMKIGAKDYIRKTLDNNYIERIVNNVKNLVGKKDRENIDGVKQDIIRFLSENRDPFIKLWKEKIHVQEERFDIHGTETISEKSLSSLFNAYITDLDKNQIADTMTLLKNIFETNERKDDILVNIELLNISFKEIAYELLVEKYPDVFDVGTSIMDQISWIVDANDLVLGKEYEKAVDKSYERVVRQNELEVRASSISDIKERLRGTINDVAKLSQDLVRDPAAADVSSLSKLNRGIGEIEKIIEQCEKESGQRLEAYKKTFHAQKNS